MNAEISKHLESRITRIADEENIQLIFWQIYSWMDKLEMIDKGLIVIDSLTELYSRIDARSLYWELKTLRAIACAFRMLPIFGVAHFGVSEEFPKGIDYLADGLVDLRFDPQLMEKGILLKQIRIRKLSDDPVLSNWLSFTVRPEQGTIPLANPTEHLQEEVNLFELSLTKISGEPVPTQEDSESED